MTCLACQQRGKTWNGGAPECAFPNGGEFDPTNWNCATANAIRNLCGQDDPNQHADYRYCDDQNYSTLMVDEIDIPSGDALALWVSWYKHRGRTEAMWLLDEHNAPRKPTEADCMAIINALTENDNG